MAVDNLTIKPKEIQLINLMSTVSLQTSRFHFLTDVQHIHVSVGEFYDEFEGVEDQLSEMLVSTMTTKPIDNFQCEITNDSSKPIITEFYRQAIILFEGSRSKFNDPTIANKIDEILASLYVLISKLQRN